MSAALLLAALLLPAPLQAELGKVLAIDLPEGTFLHDAELVDIDRDGREDLVLVAYRTGDHRSRRMLVYLRKDGPRPFASEPDYTIVVTADVVAWSVADVHPDAGAEFVLWTARAAFSWRPLAENERDRIALLHEIDLLWQYPDFKDLPAWKRGVLDFDGDGLDDLLVPEPSGYRVLLQDRDEQGAHFERQSLLALPPDPGTDETTIRTGGVDRLSEHVEADGGSVHIGVSAGGRRANHSLFAISEQVAAPQLLDWNGDGRLDLLAQGAAQLFVWTQHAGGGFSREPDHTETLPVERDERRVLDVSYSAHALHLDQDRRADCVMFAGDKRSDDVRTQVLVFNRSADAERLFGERGRPAQLLVLAGFAGAPRFLDYDSDGLTDMVIGTMRPDLIDSLRSATTKKIDIELHLYANQGGTFSKRPVLTWKVALPLSEGEFEVRFFGDVTGDGVSDVILRDQPNRLQVFMLRKRGDTLSVIDRPLWEYSFPKDARLVVREGAGQRPPELLLLEQRRLTHVRFR